VKKYSFGLYQTWTHVNRLISKLSITAIVLNENDVWIWTVYVSTSIVLLLCFSSCLFLMCTSNKQINNNEMNNNEKQVPFDAMMTTIPWSYKHGGLCQANRSVAVELSIISVALHTVDVIDCLSVRLVSLFDSLTCTCFDELPRLLDLLQMTILHFSQFAPCLYGHTTVAAKNPVRSAPDNCEIIVIWSNCFRYIFIDVGVKALKPFNRWHTVHDRLE